MVSRDDGQPTPTGLGRLCLNFVGTVAHRRGDAQERLCNPSDLASWLVRMGLLDQPSGVDEVELRAAKTLREAIYRLATTRRSDPVDVALLNLAAQHPPRVPRLSADGRGREPDGGQSLAGALSEIARDAIDLLSSPARDRIGTCAAEDCGAPFLDLSRPGRRRWCYMGRCGNRAKKASYQERRRRHAASPDHEDEPA